MARTSSPYRRQEEYPMTHLIRSMLLLTLALGLALIPASAPPEAQGKGTIKIATQSPLSGGQAALGEGIKLGA